MAYSDPFMLGPLGALLPLPSPVADGFDAPYERTQAVQRSLTGATTVDVLGAHRVWELEYEYRHDHEAARLIGWWTSPMLSQPLRLVDPITPNRLSLDAASGGGVSGTTEALALVDAVGQARRILLDAVPAELLGRLDGGYRAVVEAGDFGHLLLDPQYPAPVLATDEAMALRLWVRGSSATVVPLIRWTDAAGITTDLTGPAVAASPSWQLLQVSGVPTAGAVSATAGLQITAEPLTDAQVDLTGATLAAEVLGGWEPGGGAPPVVLTEFDHGYQRLGRRAMSLIVREA